MSEASDVTSDVTSVYEERLISECCFFKLRLSLMYFGKRQACLPGDCESNVESYPVMSMDPLECPELPRVSFETSLELPASLEPRNLDSLRVSSPELDPDPDPGPDRMKVLII